MMRIGRYLVAALFVGAGVLHFVRPGPFVRIVPPYVPAAGLLVAVSGVFEILGGAGVLVRRTRRLAGWGLVALLVAVFPANVHMAFHPADTGAEGLPRWLLWARLPLQPLLMAWVYAVACRRPSPAPSSEPRG